MRSRAPTTKTRRDEIRQGNHKTRLSQEKTRQPQDNYNARQLQDKITSRQGNCKTRQQQKRQDKTTTIQDHYKARQDKTRQNKIRRDTTRQGKVRYDKTRQDKSRQDKTTHDKIWCLPSCVRIRIRVEVDLGLSLAVFVSVSLTLSLSLVSHVSYLVSCLSLSLFLSLGSARSPISFRFSFVFRLLSIISPYRVPFLSCVSLLPALTMFLSLVCVACLLFSLFCSKVPFARDRDNDNDNDNDNDHDHDNGWYPKVGSLRSPGLPWQVLSRSRCLTHPRRGSESERVWPNSTRPLV